MPNAPHNWKRMLAQSEYITIAWNWFMILAGKAAEPVLVVSVLYASVKLLPIVHLPAPLDVLVFIAQFVALDVGGLSLNKLADQAKRDGNTEGARQAKYLSLALVAVMLAGVIMAGVNQVVTLNGQVATVIDTLLLIARAVMAVLYSRVIHSLRSEGISLAVICDEVQLEARVAETVHRVLAAALAAAQQDIGRQLEATLARTLDERLTALDVKQADAWLHFKAERDGLICETVGQLTRGIETTMQELARTSPPTAKVRSSTEAASRRQVRQKKEPRDIDQVVWPLLHNGLSVRAIAAQADTSTATVGRSRQRWAEVHAGDTVPPLETEETAR